MWFLAPIGDLHGTIKMLKQPVTAWVSFMFDHIAIAAEVCIVHDKGSGSAAVARAFYFRSICRHSVSCYVTFIIGTGFAVECEHFPATLGTRLDHSCICHPDADSTGQHKLVCKLLFKVLSKRPMSAEQHFNRDSTSVKEL